MHARIYAQRYARLVKPQLAALAATPQRETMISHNKKRTVKRIDLFAQIYQYCILQDTCVLYDTL